MRINIWKFSFFLYLLFVLNFIVLKFNGNINDFINTTEMNFKRKSMGDPPINLIPFRTIETYINDVSFGIAFKNIVGNIIPFIPMGFLLPMAFPFQRTILKTMLSCFTIILSIETIQLVFHLGSFDVDDLILNLLSCLLGFLLFHSVTKRTLT